MTVTAFRRGNRVTYEGHRWRYDDGAEADHDRPCPKCEGMPTPEGYDACIGFVPGASSVCCGHGVDASYVVTRHAYSCGFAMNGGQGRCNCGGLVVEEPLTERGRRLCDSHWNLGIPFREAIRAIEREATERQNAVDVTTSQDILNEIDRRLAEGMGTLEATALEDLRDWLNERVTAADLDVQDAEDAA